MISYLVVKTTNKPQPPSTQLRENTQQKHTSMLNASLFGKSIKVPLSNTAKRQYRVGHWGNVELL